jgi:salicylate hydroxylase
MTGVLIVGAGIGGLSAAIALGRAGQATSIIEQSTHLGELGAGVQLGPNVTRILRSWGVDKLLESLAFEPNDLQVYEALSGEHLATLALGNSFQTRYGAPYLTLHRADLHSALYQCAVQGGYNNISLNSKLVHLQNDPNNKDVYSKVTKNWSPVAPQTTHDPSNLNAQSIVELNYKAVIGADGVWSRVRDIVYGSTSSVNFSGDLAYRSLVLQKAIGFGRGNSRHRL